MLHPFVFCFTLLRVDECLVPHNLLSSSSFLFTLLKKHHFGIGFKAQENVTSLHNQQKALLPMKLRVIRTVYEYMRLRGLA